MNKDLLGECRACGQMISKNLSYRGCPKCGELSPHLTEEDERRIKEEQEEKEREEERGEKIEKIVLSVFGIGCALVMLIFFGLFISFCGI